MPTILHSLLGALALSVVLGLVFGVRQSKALRRCARVSAIFPLARLDLLVHREDMPILPANAVATFRAPASHCGNTPAISAFSELLLMLLGAVNVDTLANSALRYIGVESRAASRDARRVPDCCLWDSDPRDRPCFVVGGHSTGTHVLGPE